MDDLTKLGRMRYPWCLFAYPFYLWARSPGKQGSHYDPHSVLGQHLIPVEGSKDSVTVIRTRRPLASEVMKSVTANCLTR